MLADEGNYGYTSAVDIGTTEVTAGQDFAIDWSALTTDLLGHTLDPAADIDQVMLVALTDLTSAEVEVAIVEESLDQPDILVAVLLTPEAGQTSAMSSDLAILGNAFDPAEYLLENPDITWLLVAYTDGEARMTHFVSPVAAGADQVALSPSSADLSFDADLHSLTAASVPAGEAVTIDWAGLTTHAGGRELDVADLDRLLIARYDDLGLDELEAQFVDVELLADATWTADAYGVTTLALSAAQDDAGAAFNGFSAGSTWLLALECTECTSPAPPFLTVLEVTE